MTFDESPPPAERPPPRNRLERRMARIREEIERNRRGEAAVPTWVLALILVVLAGGLIALIVLS